MVIWNKTSKSRFHNSLYSYRLICLRIIQSRILDIYLTIFYQLNKLFSFKLWAIIDDDWVRNATDKEYTIFEYTDYLSNRCFTECK